VSLSLLATCYLASCAVVEKTSYQVRDFKGGDHEYHFRSDLDEKSLIRFLEATDNFSAKDQRRHVHNERYSNVPVNRENVGVLFDLASRSGLKSLSCDRSATPAECLEALNHDLQTTAHKSESVLFPKLRSLLLNGQAHFHWTVRVYSEEAWNRTLTRHHSKPFTSKIWSSLWYAVPFLAAAAGLMALPRVGPTVWRKIPVVYRRIRGVRAPAAKQVVQNVPVVASGGSSPPSRPQLLAPFLPQSQPTAKTTNTFPVSSFSTSPLATTYRIPDTNVHNIHNNTNPVVHGGDALAIGPALQSIPEAMHTTTTTTRPLVNSGPAAPLDPALVPMDSESDSVHPESHHLRTRRKPLDAKSQPSLGTL